jgi:hypothetical protein
VTPESRQSALGADLVFTGIENDDTEDASRRLACPQEGKMVRDTQISAIPDKRKFTILYVHDPIIPPEVDYHSLVMGTHAVRM